MIKKSILTALVMLVAYHFILPHVPSMYKQPTGPQRDNYYRAQHYVHDEASNNSVILGSSLSLRLNEHALGPPCFKLAFGGGSIFTGLEIIRTTGRRPAVVLIEMNQLGWDADRELLHDLFSPWLLRLRNHLPMFREDGRPSNFVNAIFAGFVQRGCRWGARLLNGESQSIPDGSAPNPELLARLLGMYREYLAKAPGDLPQRVDFLAGYVDELTRNGSACVFYEMPIDSSLDNLASPAAVRRAMEMRFPKSKYRWLEFPKDHSYATTDGLHLTRAEADHITETMARELNQICPPR